MKYVFFGSGNTSATETGCKDCGKQDDPQKWGPPLWKELHDRSASQRTWIDRTSELRWLLNDFSRRIPCQECREELFRYIALHPIPKIGQEYYDWTVEFHNVINFKLGKPRWRDPEKSLS